MRVLVEVSPVGHAAEPSFLVSNWGQCFDSARSHGPYLENPRLVLATAHFLIEVLFQYVTRPYGMTACGAKRTFICLESGSGARLAVHTPGSSDINASVACANIGDVPSSCRICDIARYSATQP